jgi:hypothetical protein
MATSGVVLGWIGCALFGAVSGLLLGYASTPGGIAGVMVGVAALGGVAALTKKWSWAILRAVAFGSTPALLVLGAVSGMVSAHAESAQRTVVCQQAENDADSQLAAKNFSAARTAANSARAQCQEKRGRKARRIGSEDRPG